MEDKKNILVISPRYPYKDNMGYVFVKKLVDEWVKNGYHCVVISDFSLSSYIRKRIDFRPREYKDKVLPGMNVDVYNPRIITTNIKINNISLDGYFATRAIERQINKLGIHFDIIYCHFFVSSFKVFHFAKMNNIPIFVATGESSLKNIGTYIKPYQGFNLEDFRSFTRGVIAVSTKNKNEALESGLIEPHKCIVLPNGTDLTRFHQNDKEACRERFGFPQDAFIISCVGYICERKGQNRLLEAVKRLKNEKIKILFIGEAAKVNSYHLEGEEILFKGSVENKVLPLYLSASDVFCLPTLHEGCCNAIIEAMACGLPIVSSDLPFNYDVLDSQNAILVDPRSVKGISEAILQLYENKTIRESFSRVSIERSKNLSIEQRANKILKFIESKL